MAFLRSPTTRPFVTKEIQLRLKRLLDVLGALVGLSLLSPLLAVTSVCILLTMGKPILFRQKRPGHKGRPFTLYKFRTMVPLEPDEGWFNSDERRVTLLGRHLRQTSIDELPGLINVLKGEMSLVGPRPLLVEYLEEYTAEEKRRHDMPPGITGLTQVSGRHKLPFTKRLELDLWYVDHWSLLLDIKILAKTVIVVLARTGAFPAQDVAEVDDRGLSAGLRKLSTINPSKKDDLPG